MIYEYNLHHLDEIKSKYKQHIKFICKRGFDKIELLNILRNIGKINTQKHDAIAKE